MRYPIVSIVVPVLNEEKNLPRLFESLRLVNYPKEKMEIIIVDGGSEDGTVKLAQDFGAKVFFNPLKLRGAGCQVGVEKTKGEMIAFTDADCKVPANWLSLLVQTMEEKKAASVGGPNITPTDDSNFAKTVGLVLNFLTKPGSRYGFIGGKVTEVYHNSGCNVIYKREAIIGAGGFNPKLITCEDEELDFRIRKNEGRIFYQPKVVIDHYRRSSYKGWLVQSFRYAVGRAQAGKLHWEMIKWFHLVPSLYLLTIIFTLIGGFILFQPLLLLYFPLSIVLLYILSLSEAKKQKEINPLTFFTLFTMWIIGWGVGFINGLLRTKD